MQKTIKYTVSFVLALILSFVTIITCYAEEEQSFADWEQPTEWSDNQATEMVEKDGVKYYYPLNANATEKTINDTTNPIPQGSTTIYDGDYEDGGKYYSFLVTDGRSTKRNVYAVCDGDIHIENGWFWIDNGDYQYIYHFNISMTDYDVNTDDTVRGGDVIGRIELSTGQNYCWFAIVDLSEPDYLVSWTDAFGEQVNYEDVFLSELLALDWDSYFDTYNKRKALIEGTDTELGFVDLLDMFFGQGNTASGFTVGIFQTFADRTLDLAFNSWTKAQNMLKEKDDLSAQSQGVTDEMNDIIDIFRPYVMIFAIMFWLYDLMCRIMSYKDDLITKKTVISLIVNLVLAYIFMTRCFEFSQIILKANGSLVEKIVGNTTLNRVYISIGTLKFTGVDFNNYTGMAASFLYFCMALAKLGVVLFIVLALLVVVLMITIKLFIRQLEILIMIVIAPIFYSAWVGESTRHFFAYYIKTFIMVVTQTLYMAVIFYLGRMMFNGMVRSGTRVDFTDFTNLKYYFVLIAIGVMMWKPPQSIKDIFGIN